MSRRKPTKDKAEEEVEESHATVPTSDEEYLALVGDYKPGSIRQIKLTNFLTYDNAVIYPGPRLNMVIGPNGTGKSTVLNAICLGLAGEPKNLGRADDARAFIKHGKDVAQIDITLEANPEIDEDPPTFTRMIDRNRGSERGKGRGASTYFLNNEQVSRDEIQKAVAEYNIELANLCTFLPQDKVGSFSALTSQELLLETEKTLSASQHMYITHQTLIAAEDELKKQAGQVGTVPLLEKKLESLDRDLANLERAKEKLEERERALEQVGMLKKKLIWIQEEELRTRAIELKDKKAECKKKLSELSAKLEPYKQRVAALSGQRQDLDNADKNAQKNKQAAQTESEKQLEKFRSLDDSVEYSVIDAANIGSRKIEIEQKLQAYEAKAAEYKQKLEETEAQVNVSELDEKIKEGRQAFQQSKEAQREAKRMFREQTEQLKELEQQAYVLQQKLAKQKDAKLQRERVVFQEFRGLEEVTKIVHEQRAQFRKPVHGPVACLVAPKPGTEKQHAAYLEQHVQKALWKGFVVETKQDQDLLYRLIREERGLAINIFLVDRIPDETPRPYGPRRMEQFKRDYGIAGFLDEMFTAPAPVMQALRLHCSIHSVLSGSAKTQDCIDSHGLLDILSQRDPEVSNGRTGLQNCVVCCHKSNVLFKYTSRISDYSGKPSIRADQVKPAHFLQGDNDEATQLSNQYEQQLRELHDQMHSLRPKIEQTQKERDDLEARLQEIHQRTTAWVEKKGIYKKLEERHQATLAKVEESRKELEKVIESAQQEKAQLVKKLENGQAAIVAVAYAQNKAHKQFLQHCFREAAIKLQRSKILAKERQAQEALDECSRANEKRIQEAQLIGQQYKQAREDHRKVRHKAEEMAPLKDANGNDTDLKRQLEEIELFTVNDIEAAIEECEQKIDAIIANPQVIQQYLQKVEDRKELQAKLDDAKNSRESKEKDIEQKRAPWQAALQNSVAKINNLFAGYMAELGCTGEIRLKMGEPDSKGNPANFKNWGIEIMVSFREGTKAQVLSAKVQSGGERSVSTIMYLMALQDMMVAPFRCVDEINQGLDSDNERAVFRRIVANSTKPPTRGDVRAHSGQYFLITPKLLPNLYDMEEEAVTVLFVMNGKHNFKSPTEWQVPLITLEQTSYNNVSDRGDDEEYDYAAAAEEVDDDDENRKRPAKKRRS